MCRLHWKCKVSAEGSDEWSAPFPSGRLLPVPSSANETHAQFSGCGRQCLPFPQWNALTPQSRSQDRPQHRARGHLCRPCARLSASSREPDLRRWRWPALRRAPGPRFCRLGRQEAAGCPQWISRRPALPPRTRQCCIPALTGVRFPNSSTILPAHIREQKGPAEPTRYGVAHFLLNHFPVRPISSCENQAAYRKPSRPAAGPPSADTSLRANQNSKVGAGTHNMNARASRTQARCPGANGPCQCNDRQVQGKEMRLIGGWKKQRRLPLRPATQIIPLLFGHQERQRNDDVQKLCVLLAG